MIVELSILDSVFLFVFYFVNFILRQGTFCVVAAGRPDLYSLMFNFSRNSLPVSQHRFTLICRCPSLHQSM
jgi:hypothetical protein